MTALEIRSSFLTDAKGDESVALILACYFISVIVPYVSMGEVRAGNQSTMNPKPPKPDPILSAGEEL